MHLNSSPTFIDVFAGCGGLSLGLIRAGWKGVFAIERDKNAFETLAANLLGDSSQFKWPGWLPQTAHDAVEFLEKYQKEVDGLHGQVDMLVGGPPCQGFSSAGRRDPDDPRNKLTEAYLRLVKKISPKLVLIENVKGISLDFEKSSESGEKINYAKWIIEELSQNYIASHRLIDTSTFGVPQKRIRFFIVALRKDLVGPHTASPFLVLEGLRESFLLSKGLIAPVSARSALSDLETLRNGLAPSADDAGFDRILYTRPLTAYQRLMNKGVGDRITDTRLARHKPEIVARFKKIIAICQSSGRLNVSLSQEVKASFGIRKCAIRVMDPELPSPTVTSMPDDLIHYSEPRALTVRENARLQSFPDSFRFFGKYTTGGERRKKEVPRFTQVANAVPPLMAEAMGLALQKCLAATNYFSSPAPAKKKVPAETSHDDLAAQA